MWDDIPFEIQENILKRLRIMSLLNFRSVSKGCKSLIDSSSFIADYKHTELQQHILVRYDYPQTYVSIADDDTFPHQKVYVALPESVKLLNQQIIVGCSEGLFCFYDNCGTAIDPEKRTAVIWNPAIGKCLAIDVPSVLDRNKYTTKLCFGVCPHTLDPMLVKISFEDNVSTDTIWHAEIFRLSSGAWKSLTINLPRRISVLSKNYAPVIDRFIYWIALDIISDSNLIISFDMISEVITEIRLPDNLSGKLNLHTFNGSLVVVEEISHMGVTEFNVWMMENGDPKSFIKLYTINSIVSAKERIQSVIGFRQSGEVIIRVRLRDYYCYEYTSEISVYDPKSEQIDYIGISYTSVKASSLFVCAYTKTLLLLDHPDCTSTSLYNIGHFGAIK